MYSPIIIFFCLEPNKAPLINHICYFRIGFAHGVWMVGVIDEIRMPLTGNERNLTLVETKTRSQAGFPRDPQRRNGRCG